MQEYNKTHPVDRSRVDVLPEGWTVGEGGRVKVPTNLLALDVFDAEGNAVTEELMSLSMVMTGTSDDRTADEGSGTDGEVKVADHCYVA